MRAFASFIVLIFLYTSSVGQPLTNEELNIISSSIKNKKVIGLGEPVHFLQGYYNVKIQILKHLIKAGDIDAIALEASSIETKKLDQYIKGDNLNIAKILPQLNAGYDFEKSGLFDCKEILDFLAWLRKENSNRKNKISIFGIDFQNIETPISNLEAYSKKSQALNLKLETIKKDLYELVKQFSREQLPIYFDSAWKALAHKTYSTTLNVLDEIKQRNAPKSAIDNSTELTQFAYIFTNPNLPRDSIMFENFMSQFDPEQKTVIWAAGFHIANDSIVNKFSTILTLGAYLSKSMGPSYYKITLLKTVDSIKANSVRILYSKNKTRKYDMIIKTDPGKPAIRLEGD
jgi:erythromycin esterase-like protein